MSSQLLSVLGLVAAMLNSGLIQSLVQAIELIYKELSGEQKKSTAMKMLLPVIPGGSARIIGEAIDLQVAEFNRGGVFKHKEDVIEPGNGGAEKVIVTKSSPRCPWSTYFLLGCGGPGGAKLRGLF